MFVLSVKNNDNNKPVWTMFILSSIMTFVSYWNFRSVSLAPNDWFRSELGDFNPAKWQFAGYDMPGKETRTSRYFFITNVLGSALFVSLLVFLIIGSILFYEWYKDNRSEFIKGAVGFIVIYSAILVTTLFVNFYL